MLAEASRTHDEDVAVEVFAGIPAFLHEARFLHERLRLRLA